MKGANMFFEKVEKFRYLGAPLKSTAYIHDVKEQIKF
jgi:hypothetical protein